MTKNNYTLWLFILAFVSTSAFSKTVEEDREYISKLKNECENNKKFLVQDEYSVECLNTHQHYNSQSSKRYSETRAIAQGNVRIGGYNLWHPGSQNSIHKDYKLVAKIINEFDVTSVIELLPLVNIDLKNNKSVISYIDNGPSKIRTLKSELKLATRSGNTHEIKKLKAEIKKLESGIKKAPSLYRAPGYLKLLTELRKLDPTWSLILSPRGDSAKVVNVKELTGFLYRGRVVKPITNDHCLETYKKEKGKKIACFPNLRKSFMGRETSHVFSRRPLLASFKSGKFDFSLLASHVVFTSPNPNEKPEDMAKILMPSFGVKTYLGLGTGLDSQNYARFAETKIILELIEKLKKSYKEKDVLYIGDMNIESKNKYWSELLREHSSPELLIEEATSLSLSLYNSRGERTESMASNYDHFILPKGQFSNCQKQNGEFKAKRMSYSSGFIKDYIYKNYIVRSKRLKDNIFPEEENIANSVTEIVNDYRITREGQKQLKLMLAKYKEKLSNVYTIKRDELVKDDSKVDLKLSYFKERVFMSQLRNQTFYRVYKEVLSDHYPIVLDCSNK
jgi:hypothetical protein